MGRDLGAVTEVVDTAARDADQRTKELHAGRDRGPLHGIPVAVKELIDVAGKGGGYIMANGSFFDHAKPENVQAMVEFSKEYGARK